MDLLQQPDADVSQVNGHVDYLAEKEAALLRLDDIFLVATEEEKWKWRTNTLRRSSKPYHEPSYGCRNICRAQTFLQEYLHVVGSLRHPNQQ